MSPKEIKEWREAHSLSQSQLAELLPVNLRSLQNWEAVPQKGNPPLFLWRALEHLAAELPSKNPATRKRKAQRDTA